MTLIAWLRVALGIVLVTVVTPLAIDAYNKNKGPDLQVTYQDTNPNIRGFGILTIVSLDERKFTLHKVTLNNRCEYDMQKSEPIQRYDFQQGDTRIVFVTCGAPVIAKIDTNIGTSSYQFNQ